MSKTHINRIIWILGLVVLFVTGVAVRRNILNEQHAPGWEEMPFTLESALHFRMIDQLLKNGEIPNVDRAVQYPEGVNPRQTYSISDEWVFAGICKLIPGGSSLTTRLRWISVLWFCMGIPMIALWIAWRTGSRTAGFVTGAFYAVMLASVVRSTGQELSRENFALPLLLAHMAFNALADRRESGWGCWLAAIVSGVMLALALISWDLVRFYIVILWVMEGWKIVFGGGEKFEALYWKPAVEAIAVLAIGAVNPYLRAHAFAVSPIALLALGVIMTKIWRRLPWGRVKAGVDGRTVLGILMTAFIFFIPLLCGIFFYREFGSHYGHFGELLLAKLRFFGVKPQDPGLLGFEASIMWVPALHTANADIISSLFPYTLYLTFPVLLVLYSGFSSKAPDNGLGRVAIFYVVTFISFCMFVRFHVFLAVFLAGLIGWGVHLAMRVGGWRAWVVLIAVAFGFLAETVSAVKNPQDWGRPAVYYSEMREMTEWIGEHIEGEPVLANFGVSSVILTYAGSPVVLHPKFESDDIIQRVREYGEIMFKGSELELRDWMQQKKTRYLVYSIGEFAAKKPECQMRYFVDALNPAEGVPARIFEYWTGETNWFRLMWENRKYRVFRVTTKADIKEAAQISSEARKAFQHGDLQTAEDAAARALLLYPRQKDAIKTLRHVMALREKKFNYKAGDEREE